MSTPQPLQRFGKYEILEELGRGGFGTVYKARDTKLNRIVALKVLKPFLLDDPNFVARFQHEAQAVANLKHANIVIIHELGEEQGFQYIAMEYLDGRPLNKIIADDGPLSLERASRIVAQVASALDYAHAKGLIHRDIKPGNIIAGADEHATLTDFGLVKAAFGSSVSTTGQVLGSPEYMAPEQAQGNPVDARTDVYALGIVLFEMLTGTVPFKAENTPALLFKQVYEAPPSIRGIRSDLPGGIEYVVNRALAKSPEERYQTPNALSEAVIAVVATVKEEARRQAREEHEAARLVAEQAARKAREEQEREAARLAAEQAARKAREEQEREAARVAAAEARRREQAAAEQRARAEPERLARVEEEHRKEPWRPPTWFALPLVALVIVITAILVWNLKPAPAPTPEPTKEALVTLTPIIIVVTATPLPATATKPPPSKTATLPRPTVPPALSAGTVQRRGNDQAEMVYVPAGEFTMGNSEAQVNDAIAQLKKDCSGCDPSWINAEKPIHLDILTLGILSHNYMQSVSWPFSDNETPYICSVFLAVGGDSSAVQHVAIDFIRNRIL